MPARRPEPGQRNANGQAPRPRILRIGVLLGGKIVEERLIRERISVSVGQSMRNTFSVPVDGLPLEFTLFAIDQGKYYLRFTAKMDGRLSDGGNVTTLDQLRTKAQTIGDGYFQIPLGESTRGKLSLGDLTVLFQFVTEPPRQPRPMLPASVRGTIADRIDPRLAVILIASLVVHIGFMCFSLFFYDVELPDSLADRAYNLVFKQDVYQVDLDQPKPEAAQGSAVADAGSAKQPEKKLDKPAPAKPAAQPDAGRNAADDVRRKEEEATAFADLMTADSGKDGKTEGDTNKRRPSADLGAQVADARDSGTKVAVGGNGGRGSRGNGDARVGNGHGPGLNGPGGIDQPGGGRAPESGPAGRITISDKSGDTDTSLSPDEVLRRIMNLYLSQLQRCYKDYLKKDASARGKVVLGFTVNGTGRVVHPSAEGVAPEVSSCIQSRMGGWTFPPPKDKDKEATEANFSITLQLVPD